MNIIKVKKLAKDMGALFVLYNKKLHLLSFIKNGYKIMTWGGVGTVLVQKGVKGKTYRTITMELLGNILNNPENYL